MTMNFNSNLMKILFKKGFKHSILQTRCTRNPAHARSYTQNIIIPQGEPIFNPTPSSVDQEEIRRFASVASEWWNPAGPYSMLHRMNPVRVDYVRQYVNRSRKQHVHSALPFKGLRMLDIGSGGGFLSEALARLGGSVLGVDATRENVEIAKAHLQKDPFLKSGGNIGGSIEYMHSTAEKLVQDGHQFDVVLALEIIEHVNYPKDFIQNCSRLVKDEGLLFVSTINRNLLSHLLTVSLAEDVLNWVPRGTHESDKYIKPEELEMYFEESGCKTLDVSGIGYNPLNSNWFIQQSDSVCEASVNYIAVAKKVHST